MKAFRLKASRLKYVSRHLAVLAAYLILAAPVFTQTGSLWAGKSPRQHASRLSVESHSKAICVEEESPELHQNALHAASRHVATGGEKRDERLFLTVHEVAELLQVPVSWVYGRLRKRSTEQLPGYRVGKYWRFRQEEILA